MVGRKNIPFLSLLAGRFLNLPLIKSVVALKSDVHLPCCLKPSLLREGQSLVGGGLAPAGFGGFEDAVTVTVFAAPQIINPIMVVEIVLQVLGTVKIQLATERPATPCISRLLQLLIDGFTDFLTLSPVTMGFDAFDEIGIGYLP